MTDDNDDEIYGMFIDMFKKSGNYKKQEVREFFKGLITDNEIAFDIGYEPLIGETPKDARTGNELGSFRKDLCTVCNSPILAKFWGTIFDGQTIGETSLCEKCSKGGFLAELEKESERKYQEENR